ncbi:phosphodiester glycosidase family protein [Streptomyces sp. NPDC096080]|uniref:phosphodiester glycosidase family protein n=1 Tax=Streptomyces sp. NPDC096080 TaxID=3156693 RepID=UPI00332F373B
MTHRRRRSALVLLTSLGVLAGGALAGAAPVGAAQRGAVLARGVTYREYDVRGVKGIARVHLLSVDLGVPSVRTDLLYPGAVAARATVSRMADARGAVGGVNGDFFDISEAQHPGVEATGASVGPAVAGGRVLKSAVPDGQRFGPALPPGTGTVDVFGVGVDRRARLDRLRLDGAVRTPGGRLPLGGLNQYALPVGSVGAFTAEWGAASRVRATCGTDTDRAAGCSAETYEVTVRRGRVVARSARPGGGAIAAGTTVLVGREEGARRLRALAEGARVSVTHRLVAARSAVPYRFVVGGYPVLRGGRPQAGLDDRTAAVRTAVGSADGGRRLLLLALDGSPAYRAGLTIAEVASALRAAGAVDGFSLDGGGSSTLVARAPGAASVTVRNHPTDAPERAVANGVGVFAGR